MDKMQEDFEDYMRNIFDYYDALKKEDDGSYICPHTESDWQIWQASRQVLVVSLPDASNDGEESLLLVVYKELEEHGISYK